MQTQHASAHDNTQMTGMTQAATLPVDRLEHTLHLAKKALVRWDNYELTQAAMNAINGTLKDLESR